MKTRERHAVREMKEDPSEPLCRGEASNRHELLRAKSAVVNVMVKRRDLRLRHVGIGETNASEPLETYRKCKDDIETRASD